MTTRPGTDPATILFTHYGDEWIRGSERCLLDLLSHLDRKRFEPVVWCNSRIMAERVGELGIKVYRSDFPLLLGWQRPRFDITSFSRLVREGLRLVDRHGVSLIHANSGAPNQWLNIVARARRLPLVAHLHSRYQFRERLTLGLHQVGVAVGVSQPVVDPLLGDGMPAKRIRVIPNGVDADYSDRQQPVELRRQFGLDNRDFLILAVGSLIRRKGFDLVINALPSLLEKGIPIKLVIIGDGPAREELQQQVLRLALQDHVFLAGESSNVAGCLKGGADLLVSGAREEVFGLVLAEAGLAGLPVIAPRVGGIPGVVIDGVTGMLVPAENSSALSAAIAELHDNPERRRSMGEAARQHVTANLSVKSYTENFEVLYENLLDSKQENLRWYSHWETWRLAITALRVFIKNVASRPLKTEAA